MMETISLEKNRYVSNFEMAVEEAEKFEMLQAEELVRDENGNYQPFIVEYHLVTGIITETFEVNKNTYDDVWEVKRHASLEIHVVVFDNERQKELYLQRNSQLYP